MTEKLACNTIVLHEEKEGMMSIISFRIPEEELSILKSYAKLNDKSVSEIIRLITMEHIEKEHDLKVFEEYEAEKEIIKTRPISELWKELDL